MAGFALTFRPLSFNKWEASEGIHGFADWLTFGAGLIFLSSAGLGWYLYAHYRLACWGLTGLPLLKLCLDMLGIVLLWFTWFRVKATVSTETTEEN